MDLVERIKDKLAGHITPRGFDELIGAELKEVAQLGVHITKLEIKVEKWIKIAHNIADRNGEIEAELAGMKLMEAEAESFAEDIVAENERLQLREQSVKAWASGWLGGDTDAYRRFEEALGGER